MKFIWFCPVMLAAGCCLSHLHYGQGLWLVTFNAERSVWFSAYDKPIKGDYTIQATG